MFLNDFLCAQLTVDLRYSLISRFNRSINIRNMLLEIFIIQQVIFGTRLSAKDFYKNAKKSILTNNQFYFDARHVYANAKKKLPCLKRLPELTNEMVCVLKNMETMTITYKLSVTNLEFTLDLTENTDNTGNKINDLFLPMSLRVKDSSVERSNDGDVVDFIFSKDASVAKYDTLLVEDKSKTIPSCIKHLINDGFYHEANNE